MDALTAAAPLWATQLLDALAGLQTSATSAARARVWRLLHAALFAALRSQAGRIAPVSREDLEDVASAKALELLQQAEEQRWRAEGRSAPEVAGFVRRVARNGLVDLARRRGRECPPPEDASGWDDILTDPPDGREDPTDLAAAREFVRALRACVEALAPRARSVWYRSAVLERPSRETADALGLQVGNVDVIAQRARRSLVDCMARKGHRTAEVSPRAFVLLWSQCEPASWIEPAAGSGSHDA